MNAHRVPAVDSSSGRHLERLKEQRHYLELWQHARQRLLYISGEEAIEESEEIKVPE